MKKEHSPHGNVGKDNREDVHRRCNVCNFLAGVDGKRLMHKDKHDPLGGYVCEKCIKFPLGHEKDSWKEEEWYEEEIAASRQTVDGGRNYDEIIEDLITELEKNEGR